jgi:Ala-tRNA(Pro) deacylase
MPMTRAELFERLQSLGIAARTIEHEAVFTVAESSGIERELPGGHTKNLFLKCKKGELYLIVALNDAEIDLKSLHKTLGSGRLSFGNGELLMEVLGVTPGSVTVFALVNDRTQRVRVILDESLMRHDFINGHPLENTATTNIARGDLLRFIRACGHEPVILGVSRRPEAGREPPEARLA